jgi:hypothetical protein
VYRDAADRVTDWLASRGELAPAVPQQAGKLGPVSALYDTVLGEAAQVLRAVGDHGDDGLEPWTVDGPRRVVLPSN